MIVGCGDLTILLVGLGFHCFLLKCKEKLRHSLGRPSRSDFVQFEVDWLLRESPWRRDLQMENLINELNIQDKWNPKKQVTDRTGY